LKCDYGAGKFKELQYPIPHMFNRFNSLRVLAAILTIASAAVVCVKSTHAQQSDLWDDDFKSNSLPGRRTFNATCAGCHGLDGGGGKTSPNIANNAKVERLSDAAVAEIIAKGIPGTGMPAFRTLTPSQVHAVVTYLRMLQGRSKAQRLPGDPEHGRTIFLGKGECSSCHMVQGEGGFLGPDLSMFASSRSAREVIDAITFDRKNPGTGYKKATASTHDGTQVTGLVRNEDNFSLQLQALDGSFHFLLRSDLATLQYQDHSIMPSNYGERLQPSELNDLASYLMSISRVTKVKSPARPED
jgi:cytochrome c oxidase cbb3-type subunit III